MREHLPNHQTVLIELNEQIHELKTDNAILRNGMLTIFWLLDDAYLDRTDWAFIDAILEDTECDGRVDRAKRIADELTSGIERMGVIRRAYIDLLEKKAVRS